MKLDYRPLLVLGLLTVLCTAGCKPKTTAEKVENKIEDTSHEVGQGMERAGERVKDAAH